MAFPTHVGVFLQPPFAPAFEKVFPAAVGLPAAERAFLLS
jgi:hypothetical protein